MHAIYPFYLFQCVVSLHIACIGSRNEMASMGGSAIISAAPPYKFPKSVQGLSQTFLSGSLRDILTRYMDSPPMRPLINHVHVSPFLLTIASQVVLRHAKDMNSVIGHSPLVHVVSLVLDPFVLS